MLEDKAKIQVAQHGALQHAHKNVAPAFTIYDAHASCVGSVFSKRFASCLLGMQELID